MTWSEILLSRRPAFVTCSTHVGVILMSEKADTEALGGSQQLCN